MSPETPAPPARAAWDVDALLDDRATEIVLCCGAGGVGKTTTAAALALRAAERGRRVAVLTVDPARRLAQALGLDTGPDTDTNARPDTNTAADTNTAPGTSPASAGAPRPVPGIDASAGGSLDALVLDAGGTLDTLVDAALSPEQAAAIKANPVYASLASSFSGTQEYMAMERLGQLRTAARAGEQPWDLIVVDTPPSRSALDFLDAPERLGRFLDGRFVKLLLAPARVSARAGARFVGALAGAATSGLASVMDRVLGARLLRDVEALVAGLDTVFGGFRSRAATTTAALSDERTSVVVITAPEPDPLAEAVFFLRRLREQGLRPTAVVVNRATRPVPGLDAGAARSAAASAPAVVAEVLGLQADLAARAGVETALVSAALAEGGEPGLALAVVGALAGDVVDLSGLRAVGADLAGGRADQA